MKSTFLPALTTALVVPQVRPDASIFGCVNSRGCVRLMSTSPPACRATETILGFVPPFHVEGP